MNTIQVEILCEILSKLRHQKLLDISVTCKKWYRLIKEKKCLGSYDGFINMCTNNSFLFFDKDIINQEINNLNNDIYVEIYQLDHPAKPIQLLLVDLQTIGYILINNLNHCQLLKKFEEIQSIEHNSSKQIDKLLIYGIITENINIINIVAKILYNKCSHNIYQIITQLFAYEHIFNHCYQNKVVTTDIFLCKIIKVIPRNIIKNIMIYACEGSNDFILNFLRNNDYEYYFGSVQMLLKLVHEAKPKNTVDFIKKYKLENKIEHPKLIYRAILDDNFYLTKYFFEINPEYTKYSKLLRLTIRERNSQLKIGNLQIIRLLLKFNPTYVEKKLTMLYMIKLEHYAAVKIFVQHGINIYVNPACFIIKK